MIGATRAPRLARRARLRWDEREGKFLLLYPERGLLLNEAAHAVVALCDGAHDPARMTEVLARRFGMGDPASLLPDVRSFLARLERLGLLERDGSEP